MAAKMVAAINIVLGYTFNSIAHIKADIYVNTYLLGS